MVEWSGGESGVVEGTGARPSWGEAGGRPHVTPAHVRAGPPPARPGLGLHKV